MIVIIWDNSFGRPFQLKVSCKVKLWKKLFPLKWYDYVSLNGSVLLEKGKKVGQVESGSQKDGFRLKLMPVAIAAKLRPNWPNWFLG